jgi:hypothetical protein
LVGVLLDRILDGNLPFLNKFVVHLLQIQRRICGREKIIGIGYEADKTRVTLDVKSAWFRGKTRPAPGQDAPVTVFDP